MRGVKWKHILAYFPPKGYEIHEQGGDKLIVAPKDGNPDRTRQSVRIGHKYCTRRNDELLPAHLAKIKRAFGVSRDDILM